jgi:replication initiation and membrane attachment protein DnaB
VKSQEEVEARIKEIEEKFNHVLTGSVATIQINAPRALQQLAAENQLETLHWILGTKYESKLTGRN